MLRFALFHDDGSNFEWHVLDIHQMVKLPARWLRFAGSDFAFRFGKLVFLLVDPSRQVVDQ